MNCYYHWLGKQHNKTYCVKYTYMYDIFLNFVIISNSYLLLILCVLKPSVYRDRNFAQNIKGKQVWQRTVLFDLYFNVYEFINYRPKSILLTSKIKHIIAPRSRLHLLHLNAAWKRIKRAQTIRGNSF